MSFLSDIKNLLKGNLYQDIVEYETFSHFKSVFPEAIYNFIKPKVKGSSFNWKEADEVIAKENASGVQVSFYINDNLQIGYAGELVNKGYKLEGDDVWMTKTITEKYHLKDLKFEEVTTEKFDDYLKLSKECFPDYSNNAEYCNFCFNLPKEVNKNVLVIDKGKVVAFGSLINRKDNPLALVHNIATANDARRQGYFTELIKYFSNIASESEAQIMCAEVQENSASYQGFLKAGYKVEDKYFIYVSD